MSAVTCLKVTFKEFVIKGWHFLFFVATLIQLTISCISQRQPQENECGLVAFSHMNTEAAES